MKNKYFLVVLFLVLAILLSGCSVGIVTPSTDEAKVKGVVNEYFLAVNDQNWSKVKNYCVYDSDRYYATCVLEDYVNSLYQYGVVTLTCIASISNVSIGGNYAQVYFNLTLSVSVGSYYDIASAPGVYYLQKIGNRWKIYGPGVTYKGIF